MSDKPVRTAISYSLTYSRTVILTYVELPPLHGIYLPLVEVLFIYIVFLLYILGSVVSVSCHHHYQRRRHCYDHYHVALTVGAQIFQKVLEAILQLFNFNKYYTNVRQHNLFIL